MGKCLCIESTHHNCFIAVDGIHNDGMCIPSVGKDYTVLDGDKEINQRVANVLHLLGY